MKLHTGWPIPPEAPRTATLLFADAVCENRRDAAGTRTAWAGVRRAARANMMVVVNLIDTVRTSEPQPTSLARRLPPPAPPTPDSGLAFLSTGPPSSPPAHALRDSSCHMSGLLTQPERPEDMTPRAHINGAQTLVQTYARCFGSSHRRRKVNVQWQHEPFAELKTR